jgi:tetratricopeptide (TPR) repeat protein
VKSPSARIFHISASNEDTLTKGLLEIATVIYSMDSSTEKDLPENLSELSPHLLNNDSIIVILDDLNDKNRLLGSNQWIRLLPADATVKIIFISWDESTVTGLVPENCIQYLKGLDREQCQRILGSEASDNQVPNTDKLFSDIGQAPLAIVQARHFIKDNNKTIDEYLELFRDLNERLFLVQYKITESLLGQSCSAFDSIVGLAGMIQETCPLAHKILSLSSCLDRSNIPESLFSAACCGSRKAELSGAFGLLERLGLFTSNRTTCTFDLDPFIGAVIQSYIHSTGKLHDFLVLASEVTMTGLPGRYDNVRKFQRDTVAYLDQGRAILQLYEQQKDIRYITTSALLASKLVITFQDLGYHKLSVHYGKLAVDLATSNFGEMDGRTLMAMNDLAVALDRAGNFSCAEQHMRVVLERRESLLGTSHSDTLISLKHLAAMVENQGRHDEAEAIHHKLLAIQDSVTTPDVNAATERLQNFGIILLKQGKLEEAYERFHEVLRVLKHVDEDNLASYIAMTNFGALLWAQERKEDAWETLSEVYSRCSRNLGMQNPQTIRSMCWLGLILQTLGEDYLCDAENLWAEALKLYNTRLGQYHVDTLRTCRSLAIVLHARERHGRALKLCQHVYEISRRHIEFGPRHEHTLAVKDHAKWLKLSIQEDEDELRV